MRYRLGRSIRRGGMAEVLEAHRVGRGFERRVAIKRLLPELAADDEAVAEFVEEARVLSRLHHAGIVSVIEIEEIDGAPVQVLEHVDGVDLATLIEAGPLPEALALHVAAEIAGALDYVHRAIDERGARLGIVHRDVAPDNVLVSFEGEVKLADFGIALARQRPRRTQVGIAKGKLAYMSPEQTLGAEVDGRSDLWSLGCVLHAMIARSSPLESEAAQRRAAAGAPVELDRALSGRVKAIVARALKFRPAERYKDAAAMASACAEALAEIGEREPRARLRERASALRGREGGEGRDGREGAGGGAKRARRPLDDLLMPSFGDPAEREPNPLDPTSVEPNPLEPTRSGLTPTAPELVVPSSRRLDRTLPSIERPGAEIAPTQLLASPARAPERRALAGPVVIGIVVVSSAIAALAAWRVIGTEPAVDLGARQLQAIGATEQAAADPAAAAPAVPAPAPPELARPDPKPAEPTRTASVTPPARAEARPPTTDGTSAARSTPRDLARVADAGLAEALSKRGLSAPDLEWIEGAAALRAELRAAAQRGDRAGVQRALGAVESRLDATIDRALLERRLRRCFEALSAASKQGLERSAVESLDQRYLGLQSQVRASAGAEGAIDLLREITALERDIARAVP